MEIIANLNFGNSTLVEFELEANNQSSDGIVKWTSQGSPGFEFYSIDGVTNGSNNDYIVVSMHIPEFFDNVSRNYNGLFIVKAEKNESISDIRARKLGLGKYGCPQLLRLDPAESFFEFNSNYFHPFVLKDMSVAYYVAEKRYHDNWMKGVESKFSQIAVNLPIVYDPLLGLLVTRDAQLEPDKIRDDHSVTVIH